MSYANTRVFAAIYSDVSHLRNTRLGVPRRIVNAVAELEQRLGSRKVLSKLAERIMYRQDAILVGEIPMLVVLPETTNDVVIAVKWANQHGIPIVARGAASGLSGGSVPLSAGMVMAFTRMTKLEIDPLKRQAWVEPGVVTFKISEAAAQYGLTYPPDPSSYRTSTIGGNLAENAGGPMCFKRGVTGDYVIAIEFVDATGEIHYLQRDAFDLIGLLVGSEGTLGLITGAKLRLTTPAKYTRTLMASFADLSNSAQAVSAAIGQGATPAKLEFMDQVCIKAVEDYLNLGLPTQAAAVLLIDTDGDDLEQVQTELDWVHKACLEHGGTVQVAQNESHAASLWQARRSVSPALGRIRPQRMNEDIVVPRSSLAQVVTQIQTLGQEAGLPLAQFGHIGDGNLHPNILFDPRNPSENESKVHELAHAVARVAIAHGGVLSGEHGIGAMKREFMSEALDQATLGLLHHIKNVFDPKQLLNPNKILPEADHAHS
jgi:glycolate oxidase